MDKNNEENNRRQFIKWLGMSSLSISLPISGFGGIVEKNNSYFNPLKWEIKNIRDLQELSRKEMGEDAIRYLDGGADDLLTVEANIAAFKKIRIRARRLVDVSAVDTSIELLGKKMETPIILCPVGFQQFMHPGGEVATAKAAVAKKHQMFVSSVSNFSVNEIAEQSGADLWFQLYPTPDREITKSLLKRAENAGCKVMALTVDVPVLGNRERSGTTLKKLLDAGELKMGNFGDIDLDQLDDPTMTWDMIDWLRDNTSMKILIKGIVTREDAKLCLAKGADGIIVSNHGGRQLDSGLATIDCLPEVVDEVKGQIPVLIDGGIRRGTDIFKAIALGADAVCIGRAFCYGLGAMGQEGVELALEILRAELVRDMQLAGTTSIDKITSDYIFK